MSRGLSTAALAATQATNVAPLILVELDFDAGSLYLCTAAQDFAWNGQTWIAVGALGKISTVQDVETGQISGLQFSLSSIPSAYLSDALTQPYQGRRCVVYVGFLALPTHAVIVAPVVEWAGTIDTMTVNDDGTTGEIQVTAENEMFDFSRARPLNWGDAEQQTAFPGDLGCQYVAQMASAQIIWPSSGWFKQS